MIPMVSVVVATYRRDVPLQMALRSLASQDFIDFEIVLVDDNGDAGWNEKVATIVDDFRRAFPQIQLRHIVNSPNQGSAKTRNIGIDAARGTYVAFLDDDDIYMPQRLSHQLSQMEQTDSDYSLTDLDLYNEDDTLQSQRQRKYLESVEPQALLKYHLKYHMTGTDTMMFRRSYLLQIGKFDEIDVGDEYYLMMKAIKGKGKFCYVPGCEVKAYVHTGDSLSNGAGKIAGENALYEFKKQHFHLLQKKDIRYITMRHHAVLAFTYLKQKNYGKTMQEALLGFLASPIGMLQVLKQRG